MEVNTKKILAAVATISVTTVTAGVTVTQTNAHADTVDQAATQTTNDQLKQAEQNVDVQKQNVQSATSADNQAADAVNKAQEDVNAASDATNKASQTATSDAQAVSQASDAVKTAQDQLNAASQAAANRDQAQADLDQAKSDQAAIANQNVNGQLNSAVSDAQSAANSASAAQQQASAANDQAQTALSAAQNKLSEAEKGAGQSVTQADVDAAQSAVNDAQAQKNTADQQVNAKSAAVQTADSNVSAAQTAADQANADLNNAQQNSNAKQQALSEAQQALTNAQKQGGQTSETSTKKSVADILWIPDNFETVMKGAFDNGAKLTQAQIDMLKQLYTKNVNAFTDNMDNVFSDADYDTTYDLSGRSYNVTDKQGRGTKAADELSVFAADVLNAFRTKLGVTPMTVNSAYNELTQVSVYNIPGKSEIGGLHRSDLIGVGGSSVEFDYGVTQAYPILNEPNTYSMDQLKYNVFLQLMDAMFRDYSTDNGLIQGDHAGTLLGHFGGNNPYAKHQYLLVMLNPETGSSLANTETYVVNFSPNDETAAKFSPYDYTSKLDNNNGSSADLTDLQNKVDQARTELQQAEAAVQQAQATKTAADQKLNDAKQAQSDAQTQLNQAKAAQSQAEQALDAANQKLADTKVALAEAQKNAADHTATIKNLQQQVADAQAKAAQAKKALDEVNTNVQTANDKLSQAQSALNDWTNAKKAADQKVADLQKALDNADPAAVDAAQQALADAQAKLSEAETKADASKKALKAAQAKLADAQKTLDEAQSKKSQTADALAKAQKALTAAQAELDRIKNSQPSTPDQPQTKTDAEQYGDAVQMKPIDTTVDGQLPEPQFINGFHKVVKTTDSMLVLSATKTDAVSLPEGTTASWANVNTVKAHLANTGTYYEDVLVTFPDGSTTTVKEQLNVTAAKTPDQPVTPDKPTQPSNSNKGTDITPSTSTDDHRMTTDTTTPSTSAINQLASNATGTNTVEPVANQIDSTNEYMTREEYKAQQNAKKLPQTGNDSNRALSLVGLGLATFATMFGLSKKRNF
ncbi:SEC10/PgrA surface exclusion domain-containing protein [Limosilactobacillus reuteri]|uniref:SEC10/PgrA surface exclusion domain-containing protein n=1 Tax=Limosilactobacillus reuteri TaxID=1598 RepID=UPI001E291862|nr:SEC10/PgrA surface exclusion domain-containing protein [Limosilactobacillus reuteri]MCC4399924.1 SEC10/PgrA surface exclusion domain-containing protein [Limosilactobacillus reuteri]MCC4403966.1 SEC10/PgrA surface exclusion domain-containing protein [Limosilactobacillus reuteri]